MRNVTYFPPYSQKENVITNAILVLLSQLHQRAPDIFSKLLTELSDTEFNIGPSFSNQITNLGGKGIPDALILQEPLKIYIETKLGDKLDIKQIKRHCDSIISSNKQSGALYLMGITKSELNKTDKEKFEKQCADKKIKFISTSFIELADIIEYLSDDFRLSLNSIIDEYRSFIHEQKLSPTNKNMLIINPCGKSYNDNVKFNLYQDQPTRSKTPCRYLGLYKDKKVGHIGEIVATYLLRLTNDDKLIIENRETLWNGNESPEITKDWKKRIIDFLNETNSYGINNQLLRFTVVHKFHKTDYIKTSKYGVQGHRYFILDSHQEKYETVPDIFNSDNVSAETIANKLYGKKWQ